jgi:aspartate/methionine/tyrosine aminotransferase
LTIEFNASDLKYPSATGDIQLLNSLKDYYNHFYGSSITTDNICIFSGGRPGIYNTLALLKPETTVLVEETEYTSYFDTLDNMNRKYKVIPSNEENKFRPSIETYNDTVNDVSHPFVLKSNPSNPTGIYIYLKFYIIYIYKILIIIFCIIRCNFDWRRS